MERVLSKYCGETREGNLFCLRACDCPGMIQTIENIFRGGNWYGLGSDNMRYAGVNITSLIKHGSLEFRTLQTPKDVREIKAWLDIINAIYTYAISIPVGVQIPYDISFHSPEMWVRKVLGPHLYDLVYYEGMDKDVIKDMRNIQQLYHVKPVEFAAKVIGGNPMKFDFEAVYETDEEEDF